MRKRHQVALILILGMCMSLGWAVQKPADMVGNWLGLATLEGAAANELALVLVMEEGKLTGYMTDQYGTMTDAPISEVGLEDGVFTFSAKALRSNNMEITLVFKMKVDGDSMTGTLDVPDMGMSGAWEASRQK